MTEEKKEVKIVFQEGCFDHMDFESQEELNDFVAEIQSLFAGKTAEEIMSMSRPVDMEELIEEDPELAEALLRQLSDLESQETSRKLH
jgi:hypothetical protein